MYFLNLQSFCHETWPTYTYSYGKHFQEKIFIFGGLDLKYRSLLIYKHIPINQNPITMSLWVSTLLKVCTEKILKKKSHLKIKRMHILSF